jgi:hypothetical protein
VAGKCLPIPARDSNGRLPRVGDTARSVAFRFNERTLTDAQRFSAAVSKIVGKRLTWDALMGKNDDHTFLRP